MFVHPRVELSAAEIAAAIVRAQEATNELERDVLERDVIEQFLPLADALARHYQGRGADLDDLTGVARLALVKAVRRFDPAKGDFAAYAKVTIAGEIKKYFRDFCWAIRPSRSVVELESRARAIADQRRQDRRPVTVADIAEELGADSERVAEALNTRGLFAPASLDARVREDGRTKGEEIADSTDDFTTIDDLLVLADGLACLTEDERELLRMRFYDDMSQEAIGAALGVSQMQISRRLKAVFTALRDHVDVREAA